MAKNKSSSASENVELFRQLRNRFEAHMDRHKGLNWSKIQAQIENDPEVLNALHEMEKSGGEPDVVLLDKQSICFVDCSIESPSGRRSLCYDETALKTRKENKPKGSALEKAQKMGAELLDEEQYRKLQEFGAFDLKSSSWILTPPKIRKLGGALFCDRRFDQVFVYHNGAESYYAARGFRVCLRLK